jgi:hypothetical protein
MPGLHELSSLLTVLQLYSIFQQVPQSIHISSGKRSGALWTTLATLQSGQSAQSAKVLAALAGSKHPLSERSDGFAKHVTCLQKQPCPFQMLLGSSFLLVNRGTNFIHCIEVFTTSTRKTFMTTTENKWSCVKVREIS